jgi:hydroxypyruvate isomerase
MDRRSFINRTSAAGAGLVLSAPWMTAVANPQIVKHDFKLMYAPHFGMFKHSAGEDRFDQLQFMHDVGFKALEFNGLMDEPMDFQERLGEKLRELNMTMGVFVILTGEHWMTSLTTGESKYVENFVKTCERAVDVAARVNAKWMTVVPGFYDRSLPMGIQTSNVIHALRKGAEVLEPHNLVMVLEPLSDTPELFLRTAHQTYMICTAVNSPACKILYDVYHMQRNEGHLIPNIDLCWDQIPYFQVGDVPGRKEPTSGEINYKNLFKHLHDKGYTGIVGMEHGNLKPGKDGEQALIEAYAQVDDF